MGAEGQEGGGGGGGGATEIPDFCQTVFASGDEPEKEINEQKIGG